MKVKKTIFKLIGGCVLMLAVFACASWGGKAASTGSVPREAKQAESGAATQDVVARRTWWNYGILHRAVKLKALVVIILCLAW